MKPPSPSRHFPGAAFSWGMLGGGICLLLDTCSLVLQRQFEVDAAFGEGSFGLDVFVYFCRGAFLPLFVGALSSLFAALFRATWKTYRKAPPLLEEFLWTWSAETPGRSAALLSLGILVVAAAGVGIPTTAIVLRTIHTPFYAAVVSWTAIVASLLVTSLLAPVVWNRLTRLLSSKQALKNRRLVLPGSLLLFALFLGQIAALTLALRSRTWGDAIAWNFVFAPALSLTLMLPLGVPLKNKLGPCVVRVLFVIFVLCGATAAAAPSALSKSLRATSTQPGVSNLWSSLLSVVTDFDGDQTSGLYGIVDCAPFDSAIYPGASEVANNGIDEDCDRFDLTEPPQGSLEVDFTPTERPSRLIAQPNIILITTDSLSLSRTGLGNPHSKTTPALDAWAKRATLFRGAFSSANATYASIPTLLTGSYVSEIPTMQTGTTPAPFFVDQAVLLPALLRAKGYETVALLGDAFFDDHAWPSLGDSFDTFSLDEFREAKQAEPDGAVHAAPQLTKRAISEIQKKRERPLFLWVHYFDHHNPYIPREAWMADFNAGKTPAERFDQELHYADKHWGELFSALEAAYEPEQYIAVFTADHGEAFDLNHPVHHHQFSLHTEELHVPLIVQSYAQRGRSYDELVSHLDIVPTLAALSHFRSPLKWQGESLVGPLFAGTPPQKKAVYSIFYSAEKIRHRQDPFLQIGLRTDEYYYVEDLRTRAQTLTRWREDPLERTNLTEQVPAVARQMAYYLRRQLTYLRENHQTKLDTGSRF